MRNPIRSIRKAGLKSLVGGLTVAVAVPAVAVAANPFDDVPPGQWFSEAVDWAYENDITTGKTPTTFNGDDNVTRYESVTFLQRYHENVVEPELQSLEAGAVDAGDLMRVDGERNEDSINDWDGSVRSVDTTITAPTNGFLMVEYVATVTSDNQETAAGSTQLTAFLEVGDVEAGRTFGGVDFDEHWQTNFQTMTVTAVVPVVAGEHTVSGSVANYGAFPAGGLLYIYDQSVTALFVPFDGNGLPPV